MKWEEVLIIVRGNLMKNKNSWNIHELNWGKKKYSKTVLYKKKHIKKIINNYIINYKSKNNKFKGKTCIVWQTLFYWSDGQCS